MVQQDLICKVDRLLKLQASQMRLRDRSLIDRVVGGVELMRFLPALDRDGGVFPKLLVNFG